MSGSTPTAEFDIIKVLSYNSPEMIFINVFVMVVYVKEMHRVPRVPLKIYTGGNH